LRIVNRSVNPSLADLPDWVKSFRSHQIEAIHQVREAFDDVDVVVVAAPTGSGKTLIGETIGRMLSPTARRYVCTSKLLQDQFVRDFPYAQVLKGRSNYATINRRKDFHPDRILGHVSCEDCTGSLSKSCELCPAKAQCPYEVAKGLALFANLSVLNTSYLLTEANGPGRFSGGEFTIVDEADTLEATLMNHVSVDIGRIWKYGWEPPHVTVDDSCENGLARLSPA
jgi:Rad3-related DNA helicase